MYNKKSSDYACKNICLGTLSCTFCMFFNFKTFKQSTQCMCVRTYSYFKGKTIFFLYKKFIKFDMMINGDITDNEPTSMDD